MTLGFANTQEFGQDTGTKYPADPWRMDALWLLAAVG